MLVDHHNTSASLRSDLSNDRFPLSLADELLVITNDENSVLAAVGSNNSFNLAS